MHGFLGLTWGEWASITVIISFFVGGIAVIFKYWIFSPFQGDIKMLNNNFKELNRNLDSLQDNYQKLHDQVDVHERRLAVQTEKIRHLERSEEINIGNGRLKKAGEI